METYRVIECNINGQTARYTFPMSVSYCAKTITAKL